MWIEGTTLFLVLSLFSRVSYNTKFRCSPHCHTIPIRREERDAGYSLIWFRAREIAKSTTLLGTCKDDFWRMHPGAWEVSTFRSPGLFHHSRPRATSIYITRLGDVQSRKLIPAYHLLDRATVKVHHNHRGHCGTSVSSIVRAGRSEQRAAFGVSALSLLACPQYCISLLDEAHFDRRDPAAQGS